MNSLRSTKTRCLSYVTTLLKQDWNRTQNCGEAVTKGSALKLQHRNDTSSEGIILSRFHKRNAYKSENILLVHMRVCVRGYAFACVCIYVCVYARARAIVWACVQFCVCASMSACKWGCLRVCAGTCLCGCSYACTRNYVRVYVNALWGTRTPRCTRYHNSRRNLSPQLLKIK